MQSSIIKAFIKSSDATETNRNNLLNLIAKITDNKTKNEYTRNVKLKQLNQKDSSFE
jgi:hypothetical protein